MTPNIKEKVLKEERIALAKNFEKFKGTKKELWIWFRQMLDVEREVSKEHTLAEVGKVIDEIEIDVDDGFHPIEKHCNSKELKQKIGIK